MSNPINDLAFDAVSDLLEYAPELGGSCLRWKVDRRANKTKGRMAGAHEPNGYYRVGINGRNYLAHRLVWLLNTREWPGDQLDHIDRNPNNNRFENLRQVTYAENGQNRNLYKNNTSGYAGVYWYKRDQKWVVQIQAGNKRKYIGAFNTQQEAANAYTKAKTELHI